VRSFIEVRETNQPIFCLLFARALRTVFRRGTRAPFRHAAVSSLSGGTL
jgi:hypothetical protein